MSQHVRFSAIAIVCLSALAACHPTRPELPPRPPALAAPPVRSLLGDHLLVTWYGNPHTGRMGILGRHRGAELAAGLRKQAQAYARLTRKKILPAYHLVAVIAQPTAGRDGMWRRRESHAVIQAMLQEARAYGFKLILDIQPGRSTVRSEMEYLRRYLEEPDVYLALDPEFAMKDGETPGRKIGRMTAADVNVAIDFLAGIVRERKVPPKVLMVHQFTMKMLGERHKIRDSRVVDVVLDVDGFGDRPLKRAMYNMVAGNRPVEYVGIKLFYKEDTNLMAEEEVIKLQPEPAAVVYQ